MKLLQYILFDLLLVLALLMVGSQLADASLVRDPAQAAAFRRTHACPATHKVQRSCPGYVVDHIKALDCGGADRPWNMQWQTIAAGHAKDKIERSGPGCKHRTAARAR